MRVPAAYVGELNQGNVLLALPSLCRRRAAHAERNQALTREMSRQQHAFLLAYQRDVAAGLKEQGGAHALA